MVIPGPGVVPVEDSITLYLPNKGSESRFQRIRSHSDKAKQLEVEAALSTSGDRLGRDIYHTYMMATNTRAHVRQARAMPCEIVPWLLWRRAAGANTDGQQSRSRQQRLENFHISIYQ